MNPTSPIQDTFLRRTWAAIDLDALHHNVTSIKALLPGGCRLMGVVKADAYGHGDRRCAEEMAAAGADWFGVSNLEEALSLRRAGLTQPILILGATPPEFAQILCEGKISQSVFSPDYARQLAESASRAGVTVKVHIKVDTGMGRIGFDAFDPADCARRIEAALQGGAFEREGIFTHFSSADEDGPESAAYTRAQYARFTAVLAALEARGVRFALRHCCNSAATLRYPDMHLDMVRPGVILYGLYPDACCRAHAALRPVMQLKSVVSMVKTMPEGRSVSYGRTRTTVREVTLATVPIGYADGYHRVLSNTGVMLVRGQSATVFGRVCMDQLMLDVSAIPGVSAGDEVTIIGQDGAACLTVEQMAEATGTINYETVCLIGKRVPRLYTRGGASCGVTRYI